MFITTSTPREKGPASGMDFTQDRTVSGYPDVRSAPAVRRLLLIHAMLRRDLDRLRVAARELAEEGSDHSERVKAAFEGLSLRERQWTMNAFCVQYCGVLHGHHMVEDEQLFPALLAINPDLGPVLDQLGQEHVHVAELIEQVRRAVDNMDGGPESTAAAIKSLDLLADHLDAHLAFEEDSVIPTLAQLPVTGPGGFDEKHSPPDGIDEDHH
jgi:hypothetical protein